MKDKIFIIWSGENTTALKVKHILEEKHNYLCYVGGNHQNDSQMLSVGDTVVRQMKACNQAIVIFSNKNDRGVSNNLYFELGFVSASYGMKKVHCVKRYNDNIILPSDFDNSFVECISAEDDEMYAEGIVSYFINRQKLSVDTNKMYLINNRYLIHEMLQVHYSDVGSKCSDYELAQYVLFYTQSGILYQDEYKILEELKNFKRQYFNEFSTELHQSISLCIAYLEVASNLVSTDDIVYINSDIFRSYFNVCKNLLQEINEDSLGTFNDWAKLILSENLAFVCSLYASNPDTPDNLKLQLYRKSIDYAETGITYIDKLEHSPACKENNDNVGLVSLFKAFLFRHLFNSYRVIEFEQAEKWIKLSLKERQSLLNIFDTNSVDTKIYNNFEMQYYVNLSEYIDYIKPDNIDEFEYMMYINDIDNFISKYQAERNVHAYIHKISQHRKHLL